MNAAKKMNPNAARTAFVEWLKKSHPSFYAQVAQEAGLGDVAPQTSPNIFSQILNSATGLLSQYVTSKEQLAQLKMNIARAKAGQMPLTGADLSPLPQPSFFSTVPTWVWIAGAAGAAWLLFGRKR